MNNLLNAYLKKRASLRTLFNMKHNAAYDIAVVIPAMCENHFIHHTINSLKNAFAHSNSNILIVIVVNNPTGNIDDFDNILNDNLLLLNALREKQFDDPILNFSIAFIDAATPGNEIPLNQGVGGARKIGCDSVLQFLDWKKDPLLYFLDADTIVPDNYFSESKKFFNEKKNIPGAYFKFKHSKANNAFAEKSIRLYEQYLNHFLLCLKFTGTPYAYHAVGSTIVCKAKSYIKAGGMRPKPAGEDFYFLQALCKTSPLPMPIQEISSCVIAPSPRASFRVPFGTGAKMNELIPILSDESKIKQPFFYNPHIFKLIKKIINMTKSELLFSNPRKSFEQLPNEAQIYLKQNNFLQTWTRIMQNTPNDKEKLIWAFHIWFDAFRILKFIHFCEKSPFSYEKTINPELPE